MKKSLYLKQHFNYIKIRAFILDQNILFVGQNGILIRSTLNSERRYSRCPAVLNALNPDNFIRFSSLWWITEYGRHGAWGAILKCNLVCVDRSIGVNRHTDITATLIWFTDRPTPRLHWLNCCTIVDDIIHISMIVIQQTLAKLEHVK